MQTEPGGNAESTNPYVNPTQATSVEQASLSEQKAAACAIVMTHIVRAANWFYWIAGLSLVNLVAIATGANFRFIIGLGFSEMLGGWAKDMTTAGASDGAVMAACAGGVALTAFFAACGWFARRPSMVAFIIGMAVFALDTVVFVLAQDWIGVAFHAYAIYGLWRGVAAIRQYKAIAQS
ncbi:MAG TPA: hypothetical protein VF472_03785 [Burkholderiaceae bacterium]